MKFTKFFIVFLCFPLQLIYGQNSELKVESDRITLLIGSEIKISVNVENEKLAGFKLLEQKEVEDELDLMDALDKFNKLDIISNEIEMKFCYADFMGSKIVVLVFIQHLNKAIIFKAKIKNKGTIEYKDTSITEKNPNVFCVEQWQDDIESIILYDFEFVEYN